MLARLHPGISPEQAQSILQPTFWQAASEGNGTLDPKRWPAHLGFDSAWNCRRGIPPGRKAASVKPTDTLRAQDHNVLRYTRNPDSSATLSYSLMAVALVLCVFQYTRPELASAAYR
jgi:hypothetical protein